MLGGKRGRAGNPIPNQAAILFPIQLEVGTPLGDHSPLRRRWLYPRISRLENVSSRAVGMWEKLELARVFPSPTGSISRAGMWLILVLVCPVVVGTEVSTCRNSLAPRQALHRDG